MTGCGMCVSATMRLEQRAKTPSTNFGSRSARISLRSCPAQNARPAPAITTTRTLESAGRAANGRIAAGAGATNLFIHPGFTFSVVDALLTNFHLPQSSLLMLVAAFAGRELVLAAYRDAVAQRYRFYSYGDAMLIV